MTTSNRHITNKASNLVNVLSLFDIAEHDDVRMAWNQTADLDSDLAIDPILKARTKTYIMEAVAQVPGVSLVRDRPFKLSIRSKLRLFTVRTYAVAASLVALVALSFVLSAKVHVISAPVGSQIAVAFELPDGSSGYLSAGSEIRYSDTFGDNVRLVALKGEAIFDVSKDGTSFVVQTFDTRVSVLGTSFAVRSWPGDIEAQSVISVREGRVAVAHRYDNSVFVELVPEQKISLGADTQLDVGNILPTTDNTFSWIDGGIDFVNMPIGTVLNELSRRYDVRLEAPVSIRHRRITLLPSQYASIEDVLIDMSAAVNIRYRKIAGGYEFFLN
ncbi:MAG: DUF4974 domain-containing protein [Bacteroidetes bacterium]|nr:MAG: DUF4974 domain-containing protein [Bacteroidota bacterium]